MLTAVIGRPKLAGNLAQRLIKARRQIVGRFYPPEQARNVHIRRYQRPIIHPQPQAHRTPKTIRLEGCHHHPWLKGNVHIGNGRKLANVLGKIIVDLPLRH